MVQHIPIKYANKHLREIIILSLNQSMDMLDKVRYPRSLVVMVSSVGSSKYLVLTEEVKVFSNIYEIQMGRLIIDFLFRIKNKEGYKL